MMNGSNGVNGYALNGNGAQLYAAQMAKRWPRVKSLRFLVEVVGESAVKGQPADGGQAALQAPGTKILYVARGGEGASEKAEVRALALATERWGERVASVKQDGCLLEHEDGRLEHVNDDEVMLVDNAPPRETRK